MYAVNTARQVPNQLIRRGLVCQRSFQHHLITGTLFGNRSQVNGYRRTCGCSNIDFNRKLTAKTHQTLGRSNMIKHFLCCSTGIIQHTMDIRLMVTCRSACHTWWHRRRAPSIANTFRHISINTILRHHMKIRTNTNWTVCHIIDIDILWLLSQYNAINSIGTTIVICNKHIIYLWQNTSDRIRAGATWTTVSRWSRRAPTYHKWGCSTRPWGFNTS